MLSLKGGVVFYSSFLEEESVYFRNKEKMSVIIPFLKGGDCILFLFLPLMTKKKTILYQKNAINRRIFNFVSTIWYIEFNFDTLSM